MESQYKPINDEPAAQFNEMSKHDKLNALEITCAHKETTHFD